MHIPGLVYDSEVHSMPKEISRFFLIGMCKTSRLNDMAAASEYCHDNETLKIYVVYIYLEFKFLFYIALKLECSNFLITHGRFREMSTCRLSKF